MSTTNEQQPPAPNYDVATVSVEDMFTRILQERLSSGLVERKIEERVDKLIDESIDDVFRSYGELGKAFQAAMTAAIMPRLEELADFPKYHEFVMGALRSKADEFYQGRLKDVLDAELDKLFEPLPEKMTLSYLLAAIKDRIETDTSDRSEFDYHMSLHIETKRSSFVYVYIDPEADKEPNKCAYQIGIHDGKVFRLKIDGMSDRCMLLGTYYNFEKVLFNLHALHGELILDNGTEPENYETEIEGYSEW
ncbi:hypothetical protein J8B38_16295 [Vibrio parahaemolyticus]|uniref:hypothetical protein n=2 Tax=Vibrio parahaemolyticus TaxID=670 RepID=UPI00044AE052|nr:hypothetical protein [Vibrio parahaemolyticus]EGR3344772.1 hypothetical protein [Vibrio parahaemolyticus]ELB2823404.1 hypothetical protein [Vibrio parahaemolyticus]ETX66620.1 hypothetical protein D034_4486 [Vibrio parahaemolyticus Peru-288]KZW61675.1 hypothetical protein APF67_00440 [Vibrio parahaemolyticus]MBM5216291.1 hypothetical protein [Vibrio parahaemolyticus]